MTRKMTTKVLGVFAVLGSVALSTPSWALEVGDLAPGTVLTHVEADGSMPVQGLDAREKGRDFVLLEFFQITCQPCEINLPRVARLADETAETTTTRIVSIDRKVPDVLAYVEGHKEIIKFSTALDNERAALRAYGVKVTPTVFVLDAENRIVFKSEGVLDSTEMQTIRDLVQKK